MNIIRKIVVGIAGIVVVALALSLAAPKAVHAVVSTLVTVTNTPNVNVVNSPSVRDADNPARQPFQASFNVTPADNVCFGQTTFQIPAKQELVIEYASATAFIPGAGQGVLYTVETTAGGANVPHHLFTTPPVNAAGIVAVSQLVRVYADPGTTVTVTFSELGGFCGNGVSQVGMELSGFLVNVP